MLYLKDVITNWFHEANPHLVPSNHETKKDEVDKLEVFCRMPLVIVDENVMDYIEYGYNEIPFDILMEVYMKAYSKDPRIKFSPYTFVVTDKVRIMAVQVDIRSGFKVDMKSRVAPKNESEVYKQVDGQSPIWTSGEVVDKSKYKTYTGKTRSEREASMKAIKLVKKVTSDRLDMLRYLLSEWNYPMYQAYKEASFKKIKDAVLHKIEDSKLSELKHINEMIEKLNENKLINQK